MTGLMVGRWLKKAASIDAEAVEASIAANLQPPNMAYLDSSVL
jgi:hypothetical protein